MRRYIFIYRAEQKGEYKYYQKFTLYSIIIAVDNGVQHIFFDRM